MHLVKGLLEDETLSNDLMGDGNTHVNSVSKGFGVFGEDDTKLIRKKG
jgi:hypothetical protein